jgi:hypothetical protein
VATTRSASRGPGAAAAADFRRAVRDTFMPWFSFLNLPAGGTLNEREAAGSRELMTLEQQLVEGGCRKDLAARRARQTQSTRWRSRI